MLDTTKIMKELRKRIDPMMAENGKACACGCGSETVGSGYISTQSLEAAAKIPYEDEMRRMLEERKDQVMSGIQAGYFNTNPRYMTPAVSLIDSERQRQIDKGFSAESDTYRYQSNELLQAGLATLTEDYSRWPLGTEMKIEQDPVKHLVRGIAFLVAHLDSVLYARNRRQEAEKLIGKVGVCSRGIAGYITGYKQLEWGMSYVGYSQETGAKWASRNPTIIPNVEPTPTALNAAHGATACC